TVHCADAILGEVGTGQTRTRGRIDPKPMPLMIAGSTFATFDQIWLTDVLPGPTPYLRQLRLADRRWLWQRLWLSGRFNVRRAPGDRFLTNDSGLLEVAVIQPEIEYQWATLYPIDSPAKPWTAEEILKHLVESPPP